jgi:hypothetical protein
MIKLGDYDSPFGTISVLKKGSIGLHFDQTIALPTIANPMLASIRRLWHDSAMR